MLAQLALVSPDTQETLITIFLVLAIVALILWIFGVVRAR